MSVLPTPVNGQRFGCVNPVPIGPLNFQPTCMNERMSWVWKKLDA